jgi:hypothetical protein
MNGIGKLFLRLLALLFILGLVDFLLGQTFGYLLTKQTDGRYYKIKYSLDNSNEQIIILGSSRAETDYNPAIFKDVLGMNCWNTGRGGQSLNYFLAIEQEIFNRYSPKLIILNIDPNTLKESINYDRTAILRPFSRDHTSIFNILSKKDWVEKYKLQSNIYLYNSSLYYFFRPFIVKNKDGKPSERGWKPRRGCISRTQISQYHEDPKEDMSNYRIDPGKTDMLNKIIQLAKSKNSLIVLAISPDFFPLSYVTPTMKYIFGLVDNKQIYYFDFSSDKNLVENPKYYYDLEHMNEVGANVYSSLLARKISEVVDVPFQHLSLHPKLKDQ